MNDVWAEGFFMGALIATFIWVIFIFFIVPDTDYYRLQIVLGEWGCELIEQPDKTTEWQCSKLTK